MKFTFRSSLLFFVVKYGLCQASMLTWNGSSDQMNQSTNWLPSQVPATGDELTFPTGVNLSKSVLNNIGSLTVGNLSIADAYTFTGSSFVIPTGTTTLTYGASGSNINLGGVTLNGTLEVSSNGSGNTITSALSGSGGVNLQGGLLVLNGVNTYTGATTLGVGATLKAGSTSAFGHGSSVSIGSGSILDLNNFNTSIGNISGTSASTVSLGTATLTVVNSGTNTFAGTIKGANAGFSLGAGSSGVFTLSGNNTYSTQADPGTTNVAGGTLQVGYPAALGSYSNLIVASGATLDLNNYASTFSTLSGAGTITLGSATITSSQGGTFSGQIQGSGGVTLTSGTLTLTGSNTYTGTTSLQGGSIFSVSALGNTSGFLFSSGGGTLQLQAPISTGVTFTFSDVATIDTMGNTVTLSGPLSGPGVFSKKGTGTLILTGANGYTGGTNILAGTIQAGSTASLGTNSSFNISAGATLNLNNFTVSIQSLAGNIGSFVNLGSGTLTVTGGSAQNPFYGVISGSGNLSLTGGTLSLMKTNTYTGTTSIQGGSSLNTVNLGSTSSLIFVSGGGNIEFGSNTTSAATLVADAPVTIGTNTFQVSLTGAISGSGAVISKIGLGTLTLTGVNTNAGPFNIEGGTLNLNASSLGAITSFTFETFAGVLQAGSALTISQPITLTANGTIDTNGNAVTLNGPISGPGAFTKAGAGVLTVGGACSYSGITAIQNGTLSMPFAFYPSATQLVFQGSGNGIFQTATAFTSFSSSVIFMSGGSIDTNGFDLTASGVFAGVSTASFTKVGAGALTLTGTNIYTGATTVNAGSLLAGSNSAFGVNSAITVASAGSLNFQTFANTVGSIANSGLITGSATVTATSFTQTSTGNLSLNFPSTTVSPVGNILTTGAISLDGALAVTNTGGFTPSSSFEVVLLKSSGAGKQLQGQFSSTTSPFGIVSYDYSDNQVVLAKGGTDSNWVAGSTGNWGNPTNWSPENIPGGGAPEDQDTVSFSNVTDSDVVVTLANGAGTAPVSATLHSIYFDADSTSFTINQFNSGSAITLNGSATGSKSRIQVLAGNHVINTAILLEKDTRISLFTGSLTLGADSSIGSSGTLYVSEGVSSGLLTNYGAITPGAAIFEGNLIDNHGTISPVGALTISALAGTSESLIFNNYGVLSSGDDFIVGGVYTEIYNFEGATLFAGSGKTLYIQGGSLVNTAESGLGSNEAAIVVSGGELSSFGEVLASSYTQTSEGTLILGFFFSGSREDSFGSAPVLNSKVITQGQISLDGTFHFGSIGSVAAPLSLTVDSGDFLRTPFPVFKERVLLQSLGAGKQLTGEFSVAILPYGSIVYDYSENLVLLANGECNSTWQTPGNGNWADIANWDSGCVPGVSGVAEDQDMAHFVDVDTSEVTVSLATSLGDGPLSVVLHDLSFESENTSFTIEAFNSESVIHLDGEALSSKAKISLTGGSHTIDATASLEKDTRVSLSNGSLTFGENSSIISTGTLNVSEGATSGTFINLGQITPGAVLFEGNKVNNYGLVNPVGSLIINSIDGAFSPVVVNNYGVMKSGGDFTIEEGSVFNSAKATLGSSLANLYFTGGTLSTEGKVFANNYEQHSQANLEMGVSSISSFASLTASGSASLGGSFVVTAMPDFSMSGGQKVNLITAVEGVLSKFTNYSLQNFPHTVIPSLSFHSNAVTLNIVDTVPAHFNGMHQIVFTAVSQHNSFVTRKMYQMRNRIPADTQEIRAENSAIVFGDDEVTSAKISLASTSSSKTSHKVSLQTEEKQQQLTQRIQEDTNPWSVYAGPVGSFGHVKTKGKQIGLGYSSAGALLGFDYLVSSNKENCCLAGVGAILEYRKSYIDAADHFGSANIDAVQGSLYGTVIPSSLPDLAVESILGFDYTWDHISRKTGVDKKEKALGNTNESLIDALIGLEYQFSGRSYDLLPKNFSITPLANLQYVVDYVDGYKEKGAGIYDLRVGSEKPDSLASLLGFRMDYLWKASSFILRTEFDCGWQREYLQDSFTMSFTPFHMTQHSTKVRSVAPGRNNLVLGLDVLMTSKGGWQLESNVNYQLNSLFYDVSFYLGLGRQF